MSVDNTYSSVSSVEEVQTRLKQEMDEKGYTWSSYTPGMTYRQLDSRMSKDIRELISILPAAHNELEMEELVNTIFKYLAVPPDGLVEYENCVIKEKTYYGFNYINENCMPLIFVNRVARQAVTDIMVQYMRDYTAFDVSKYMPHRMEATDYIYKEGGTLLDFIQMRSDQVAEDKGFDPYEIEPWFLDKYQKIPKIRVKYSHTLKDSAGDGSSNYLVGGFIGVMIISLAIGGWFLWNKLFPR